MDKKICGVTGHRKIPAEYAEQVKQGLLYEIEKRLLTVIPVLFPAFRKEQNNYLRKSYWKSKGKSGFAVGSYSSIP